MVILHYGQSALGIESIIAALEYSNRLSGSLLETVMVSEAMRMSFPAATDTRLGSHGGRVIGISDSFLYLPPRPRSLVLKRISYDCLLDKVKTE
jgi:hypothetical protein